MESTNGTLNEALRRLHRSGPEFRGFLANHGPMAVEALVRHGRENTVHRWLDGYTTRLEEVPRRLAPIIDAEWREALGDTGRAADWTDYFIRHIAERPWREVLTEWWPRLLPGIAGAAAHPVIRVGHAVRALDEGGEDEAVLAELAHALGYWAARHTPLPAEVAPAGDSTPARALPALPRVAEPGGLPLRGYAQLPGTPGWRETVESVRVPGTPEEIREQLTALVRAATLHYGEFGHGNGVMLVHAATAPNAVLRTLPALPEELWAPSFTTAWAVTAAITSIYAADTPRTAPDASSLAPEEVFERAVEHGDEHVIKFADTALDVAAAADEGDERALAAALNAIRLIDRDD